VEHLQRDGNRSVVLDQTVDLLRDERDVRPLQDPDAQPLVTALAPDGERVVAEEGFLRRCHVGGLLGSVTSCHSAFDPCSNSRVLGNEKVPERLAPLITFCEDLAQTTREIAERLAHLLEMLRKVAVLEPTQQGIASHG
jgi:hypothetical protein